LQADTSEWNLFMPSACTAPFTTMDGRNVYGIQHSNMTTKDGVVVCLPVAHRGFSLTFQPSTVSVDNQVTLEFAIKNPDKAPLPLWNRWRVQLFHMWPSVRAETKDMDTPRLAAQRTLFEAVSEANFVGFSVIRTFKKVFFLPSEYAVNSTAEVSFELVPRSNVPLNGDLLITAPVGFVHFTDAEGDATFQRYPHRAGLTLHAGTSPNQARLAFGLPHAADTAIRFVLAIRNPSVPPLVPLWEFELRDGDTILERTFGFKGFHVYYLAQVVGLFGSVREIGSKYNFVRITFKLPAALGKAGKLRILAAPGYTVSTEGFLRDNLPAFSTPVLVDSNSPLRNPLELNISITFGLDADRFYAFRFGVSNPPAQLQGVNRKPWELWCYNLDGTVLAANRNVPPFKLEARFRVTEVLPSSVTPLKASNLVVVRMTLDSSPLNVVRTPMQHDIAFIILDLPPTFILSMFVRAGQNTSTSFACNLDIALMGPSAKTSLIGGPLVPLPAGALCHPMSASRLGIEVQATLSLGLKYYFAVEVQNPLLSPSANAWKITTERNGQLLHSDINVHNFVVSAIPLVEVVSTDVRRGLVQMLHIELRPPLHVRGLSAIELRVPEGYELYCRQKGKAPPLGVIPADTECLLQGSTMRMILPRPVAYAPYVPLLLAGETYYFGAYCGNALTASNLGSNLKFDIRLVEEWPSARIVALRADLPAPALAGSLAFFEITAGATIYAGKPTMIAVRFTSPKDVSAGASVQAVFLQGPVGMQLSEGESKPCVNYQSRFVKAGDSVLPQSVCSGVTLTAVVIQLPEPLILTSQQLGGLRYVFELEVICPRAEVLIDTFLLSLLPGPGADPVLAGNAPGFARRILGLSPSQLPETPAEYVVPVPRDNDIPPMSTVQLEAAVGQRACPCVASLVAFTMASMISAASLAP